MAIAALDRLGIAQAALQRADTLSGGQQQRVAIARALMQEPEVLLADEPIASLDPQNAKAVMDALRDINEREGITVICNLHTLDTARNYCERIIGMARRQGRLRRPARGTDPYCRQYLRRRRSRRVRHRDDVDEHRTDAPAGPAVISSKPEPIVLLGV